MMRRFEYAVTLKRAKERGFVVTCRDLPEVTTQGEDANDALAQAVDAMDEAFAARMEANEDFPTPTRVRKGEYIVSPPAETVAKAALYVAMREAGVNRLALAKRLGIDEKRSASLTRSTSRLEASPNRRSCASAWQAYSN